MNTRRSAISCRFWRALARADREAALGARPGARGRDPLADLVEAQAQRMADEGLERRTHRRYVVWGDVAR